MQLRSWGNRSRTVVSTLSLDQTMRQRRTANRNGLRIGNLETESAQGNRCLSGMVRTLRLLSRLG
eukprot:10529781-Karenia_brevis.AAC.1